MLTLEVFIGTISTLAVLATGAFFWILSEIRSERQERRSERESDRKRQQAEREEDQKRWQAEREEDRRERRADTQRILEAIYFHRHDPNTGEAVFYPPAPHTSAD